MNTVFRFSAAFLAFSSMSLAQADSKSEPATLSRLRSTYLDKQAEAARPVRKWYAEELQRLERTLVATGDILGAAKVREERAALEQPALIIAKATWGTKEKTTDITQKLQTFVRGNKLDVVADDPISDVDPAPKLRKQAVITYRLGETERTITVKHFDRIKVP